MQILIIDDEPLACERLAKLCTQLGHQSECVTHAERAVANSDKFDVALVDIEMPAMNGLQVANLLACPVIFCTAHEQYAMAAFNAGALHYLTKPVRNHRLKEALARVELNQEVMRFSTLGGMWQLNWSQVVFAQAQNKLTILQSLDEQRALTCSLQELEQQAPDRWLRISRSVLINPTQVRDISGDQVTLYHTAQALHISRRQRANVHNRLKP